MALKAKGFCICLQMLFPRCRLDRNRVRNFAALEAPHKDSG